MPDRTVTPSPRRRRGSPSPFAVPGAHARFCQQRTGHIRDRMAQLPATRLPSSSADPAHDVVLENNSPGCTERSEDSCRYRHGRFDGTVPCRLTTPRLLTAFHQSACGQSVPRQRRTDAKEVLDHCRDIEAPGKQIAVRNLVADLVNPNVA